MTGRLPRLEITTRADCGTRCVSGVDRRVRELRRQVDVHELRRLPELDNVLLEEVGTPEKVRGLRPRGELDEAAGVPKAPAIELEFEIGCRPAQVPDDVAPGGDCPHCLGIGLVESQACGVIHGHDRRICTRVNECQNLDPTCPVPQADTYERSRRQARKGRVPVPGQGYNRYSRSGSAGMQNTSGSSTSTARACSMTSSTDPPAPTTRCFSRSTATQRPLCFASSAFNSGPKRGGNRRLVRSCTSTHGAPRLARGSASSAAARVNCKPREPDRAVAAATTRIIRRGGSAWRG